MVKVLDDERLHAFIGGHPADFPDLHRRYGRLVAGSGDPGQIWLNWIVRRTADHQPIGTVQATLTRPDNDRTGHDRTGHDWTAAIAWVIGVPWQAQGFAVEAARALIGWLHDQGANVITATIHPDHHASAKVATRAGLTATTEEINGERVWRSAHVVCPAVAVDDAEAEVVGEGLPAG